MATMTVPQTAVDASRRSGRAPVGGVLTARTERMIRLGSLGSAVVIAACAMVLSYAGLHDLALDAEVPPRLALLVPIMVDGLQFVGSLGVIYSTLSGLRSWYPWTLMLMGVSISAWGNWQASPDQLTAKLLHAAAPVILALVLEELLRVMRHKVSVHAAEEAALAAEVEASQVPQGVGSQDLVLDQDQPPVPTQGGVAIPAASPAHEPAAVGVTVPEPVQPHKTEQVDTDRGAGSGDGPETWLMRDRIVPLSELRSEERETPGPATLAARAEQMTRVAATSGDEADDAADDDDAGDSLPSFPEDGTMRDKVAAILEQDPTIPAGRIARVMDRDPSYVRKIVREVKRDLPEGEQQQAPPVTRPTVVPEPVESPKADRDLRSIDPFSVGPTAEFATR